MSCRFQPDYRGDAMFRGDAMGRTEPCLDFTFDILDGGYIPSPVIPGLIPRDSFLNLACGETIEGVEISTFSRHALYRTSDFVANHSYLARFFNIQIDDPDDCAVILDNVDGFNPYVTVHRSGDVQWQGTPDVHGIFKFTVEIGQTGPMTVEISSVDRYETGSFDIELDCHFVVVTPGAEFAILFHIPAPGCVGDFISDTCYDSFNNASLHIRVVNQGTGWGSGLTVHWDFGDGQTADNVFAVNHNYAAPGTYTITYTMTDDFNTDNVSHDVTVAFDI